MRRRRDFAPLYVGPIEDCAEKPLPLSGFFFSRRLAALQIHARPAQYAAMTGPSPSRQQPDSRADGVVIDGGLRKCRPRRTLERVMLVQKLRLQRGWSQEAVGNRQRTERAPPFSVSSAANPRAWKRLQRKSVSLLNRKQFCWFKRDRLIVRAARAVAKAYGQAVRASRWPVSTNPKGRASFRQAQRRSARPYPWVCPSPIAFALTKTCSGRTFLFNKETL